MKAIQITMDESLLAEFDADGEVQSKGRSAILRRVTADYLARRKRNKISADYKQAYRDATVPENELEGWQDEGEWPTE